MAGPKTAGIYGLPTRIPAIPDVRSAKVEEVVAAVKEWVEVREGTRGDGLDRAVTLRDLLNSGLATPFDLRDLNPGGIAPMPLSPGDQDPDTPPTPEALEASGTFKYILLTWQFARGYSRLAYFEIWRSTTNAIGDAVLVAQTFGSIYADDVGQGQTYYYWVRAVSDAPAVSPFNALQGTLGQTAIDPGYLIELLTGKITESQLHQDLGSRIDLIEDLQQTTSAQAQSITQLSSTVGGHTTTIQTQQTSLNGLSAQYTVKVDNNGWVSGFGLASTTVNGVPSSAFYMRVDSFAVGSPADGMGVIPFAVRTVPTVIGGVPVPIGVYIKEGLIENGSISNAKIGNLQVDDAKIVNLSVAKLLAGKLGVSEYIESTNYAAGDTGFRIHGNGNAELSNATVRGTVRATAGHIGDILISPGNGIYSANWGPTSGFHISSSGVATFNQAIIRGQLVGVTGTFSGDISGASGSFTGGVRGGTGYADHTSYAWPTNGGGGYHLSGEGALFGNPATGKYFQIRGDGNLYAPEFTIVDGHAYFSGELTAQAINAVDTINLRGQSVTIPLSAYGAAVVAGLIAPGGSLVLQSLTINSTGAPILIIFSGLYYTETENCYFSVIRNGTTIYNSDLGLGGYQAPFCAALSDTPGVGTFTYQWCMTVPGGGSNGSGGVENRSLTLLETKR